MTKLLVDTGILIDCLRGRAPALAWFRGLPASPAISVITLTELQVGARSQREQRDMADFRSELTLFDVTEPIADRGGVLMRHYRSSHGIDVSDALIAATVEHHGLALATLNLKHFPMFKGLKRPY